MSSAVSVPQASRQALYPQAEPGAHLTVGVDQAEMRNPADLGFPPLLPIELALKIDTPKAICEHYGITRAQFELILKHPVFQHEFKAAVEMLKIEGMSFKLKAKLQAEDFLGTSYAMVKNPATSDAVRADLIKSTVRWAGLDQKATDAGGGNSFNIQINLG